MELIELEKYQNSQKVTWSHRVKQKSRVMKNGRIESDDFKDWCYFQIWNRCENN